jgi:hypothetical protein
MWIQSDLPRRSSAKLAAVSSSTIAILPTPDMVGSSRRRARERGLDFRFWDMGTKSNAVD